jgi:MoxR-like ATPase
VNDVDAVKRLADSYGAVRQEVGKVIVGQEPIIEQVMIALLSRGHCLLIGVPGLAKTLLIKTLAQALDLTFSRIQFTPDLMPSDITGTEILEQNISTGEKLFKFIRGPVFANIVLADEINRTPPKTQSALLESMQEYHVTIAGEGYRLDQPFFVLATQNPIEQEGTYPLPEAQLDRFMFNLWLDYPAFEEEMQIVRSTTSPYVPDVRKALNAGEILAYQELVRRVPVSDHVIQTAVSMASRTRPGGNGVPEFVSRWIRWGAGPRASQYLILGAKARAILQGRTTPDVSDLRALAAPVLRHRIVPSFTADAEGVSTVQIIERLMDGFDDMGNVRA